MAYVPDNLCMITDNVGGFSPRVFTYLNSTPDADAAITTAGYFSDGVLKGMRLGDLVDALQNAAGSVKYKRYQVTAIVAATGVVTVAAPIAIT